MKPPHKIPRHWQLRKPHQKRSGHTCPLSDSIQPHKLIRHYSNVHTFSVCFGCKGKHLEIKRYFYYCSTCNLEFHRGCHVFPLLMTHPLHDFHPLTLTYLDPNGDTSKIPHEWKESASDSEVSDYDYLSDEDGDGDFHNDHEDDVKDVSPTHIDQEKCKCCRKPFEDLYYHCSICNFSLNFTCTIKPPPYTISHNGNSHIHILTLFPRRIPLPCDVCGLSLNNIHDVVYACLPCNYMVHRKCIYLPRVIKITRHQHRLSLISSFPSGNFSCGVCHQPIDVSYGHYTCDKECHYGVHSKCATRKDVWDGKDLEDVPEKPEMNIESFERIDMETIRHFTHEKHYLKLQRKGSILGVEKFCEACCFPVLISDDIYSCTSCNFVLHEACASLPRVKHHPLHKHPLNLHQYLSYPYWFWGNDVAKGMFQCHGCERRSSGFVYRCGVRSCTFQLDVRCASIVDGSVHKSHQHDHHDHPLFISLRKGKCMGCKSSTCSGNYLECIKCKSFLGLHCATLPSVATYKHDSHPLTLCYGEKGTRSGQYWCELCELKLDASEWFYTCDSCRVTLHVTCLLGIDMYMKPQHTIRKGGVEVEITRNNGNSRPLCYKCRRRCIDTSIFKCRDEYLCSLHCIEGFLTRGSKKRREVCKKFFPIDKIGVDSRLEQIESVLSQQPTGVRSIGIWGMAGIGKTTIVEAAFERMKKDYTYPCFIQKFDKNLQEKGLYCLREQQLPLGVREKLDINTTNKSQKGTVFVVLDDVRKSINAESFLRGFDWFDPGSLIIITSRDIDVLRQCRVNDIYEVKGLDDEEALKLFSECAFGERLPKEGYLKMSEMVVKYANGNAKALSHYGRELKGKTLEEMETKVFQLKKCPPPKILKLVKSSYDEFSDNEKKIFLDIACFFKGELVEHVMQVLERCGFFCIGFKYLIDKSLVFVSQNKLEMHNMIQDVAWEIQNQEVRNGKARRLWNVQSIQPLLEDEETKSNGKHNLERENIETMLLDASGLSFVVDPEAFQSMCNLRLLKIYCSDHEHPPRLVLQKGLVSLPSELRILHWEYYPYQTLPDIFDPDMLVELIMPYSQLEQELWEGDKSLQSLKTINLHDSKELVTIYEVSEAPNLELINLQGCTSLESFPTIRDLEHLKILNLCGCAEMKFFPEVPPNIEELYLNGTDMREVPSSIESLSKLVKLDLGNCKRLENFPIKIYNMESLELLNLSGCITLNRFPKIKKRMAKLQYLYLSCTAMRRLHTSVSRLIGLKVLKVSKTLQLPNNLTNLKYLKVEYDEEIEHSL